MSKSFNVKMLRMLDEVEPSAAATNTFVFNDLYLNIVDKHNYIKPFVSQFKINSLKVIYLPYQPNHDGSGLISVHQVNADTSAPGTYEDVLEEIHLTCPGKLITFNKGTAFNCNISQYKNWRDIGDDSDVIARILWGIMQHDFPNPGNVGVVLYELNVSYR